MDLPEALRKQKENFLKAAPQDTVAVMSNAIKDLSNSKISAQCLQKGDKAPDFTLEDSQSNHINVTHCFKQSPLILKFFRGDW